MPSAKVLLLASICFLKLNHRRTERIFSQSINIFHITTHLWLTSLLNGHKTSYVLENILIMLKQNLGLQKQPPTPQKRGKTLAFPADCIWRFSKGKPLFEKCLMYFSIIWKEGGERVKRLPGWFEALFSMFWWALSLCGGGPTSWFGAHFDWWTTKGACQILFFLFFL